MDLSLESALTPGSDAGDKPGQIAGRSLDEWNAAYSKVESYLHALRVRNKVLLGRLVIQVLRRAIRRATAEPQLSATQLAMQEMDNLVAEWFAQVLQHQPTGSDQMLSTRGRLALLLADMPGKWQDQFLRPGPWPDAFVAAMRKTFVIAGPNFQLAKMAPRPLDLGPITHLTNLSRLSYTRMLLVWLLLALVFIFIFRRTH
jgi:hypothetical protein